MDKTRIEYLFQRYLEKTCTANERKEFFALLDDPSNAPYLNEINEKYPLDHLPPEHLEEEAAKEILEAIFKSEEKSTAPVRRIHLHHISWLRYAAAVLLVAALAIFYYHPRLVSKKTQTSEPSLVVRDKLPGSHKAILTLSTGQKIPLNASGAATIQDGSLSIQNKEGRLRYASSPVAVSHTVTTPRGSEYQLSLADGTRVWLNAASSLTYPTSFTGKRREVSVYGEAYFEVAPNPKIPFVVKSEGEEIVVLGTSFNLNSYKEEGYSKISLLEGSVRVGNTIVKPGQAWRNGKIIATNIAQDVAWKNGVFDFNRMPLQRAMNQLARWYDVEIVYKGNLPPFEFYGRMGKDLTLGQVIKGLSGLGLNFTIENENKLMVSPM